MSGPFVLALRLLLAFSLYAFLGWAFYNLWRDIKQQGELLALRKIPPIKLTINPGKSTSETRDFLLPEVIIGRDPACECRVDDETVSIRHARLSFHQNQWWLEDLNSTNGTTLNQGILNMPTVVMTDDEFRCGDTLFVISIKTGV
jgi:pSer/pThr/pTyr-binding forkhead associated (FHA) protein